MTSVIAMEAKLAMLLSNVSREKQSIQCRSSFVAKQFTNMRSCQFVLPLGASTVAGRAAGKLQDTLAVAGVSG